MKARLFTALSLTLALAFAAASTHAQDPSSAPQAQDSGGGQQGPRGGRGMWGGGMMAGARGLMGTVTAVAADHYSVRTDTGEVYTVYFSVNTRIVKQRVRRGQPGQSGSGYGAGGGGPEFLKATDIKVGDVIAAGGQLDASAKTVGAVFVVQLDPERARQMQQMEASYGKTWLMGRVTAIDGVNVTLQGIRDKKPYTFAADENTTFRHRREPITLADVHIGDLVRVEGAIKDGVFLATTVADVGAPQETRMPRGPGNAPPPDQPPAPQP
ncbi:MAG TPA: DUF5666 domain-containing protein [Terracidiphilus sp.]|nr:DUF5666 domain-containing protein [Terracidiphilus sp.]